MLLPITLYRQRRKEKSISPWSIYRSALNINSDSGNCACYDRLGNMCRITLPPTLELGSLMSAMMGIEIAPEQKVTLDFQKLDFVTPQGMGALAALIDHWIHNDYRVLLLNAPLCRPFEYLQRMNFFKIFGVFVDEKFSRHSQAGRFAALEHIRFDSNSKKIADNLVNSISGGEAFNIVRSDLNSPLYESINNIIDHARLGSDKSGYAVAQSYRLGIRDRRYVFAIVDSGRGVAVSLRDNQRLCVPDDLAALELACKRDVTGSEGVKDEFGDPRNVGQGLFEIDQIAKSTKGTFSLCSGNAIRRRTGEKVETVRSGWYWQGTIVIVTLTYSRMREYIDSITPTGKIRLGRA